MHDSQVWSPSRAVPALPRKVPGRADHVPNQQTDIPRQRIPLQVLPARHPVTARHDQHPDLLEVHSLLLYGRLFHVHDAEINNPGNSAQQPGSSRYIYPRNRDFLLLPAFDHDSAEQAQQLTDLRCLLEGDPHS